MGILVCVRSYLLLLYRIGTLLTQLEDINGTTQRIETSYTDIRDIRDYKKRQNLKIRRLIDKSPVSTTRRKSTDRNCYNESR